MLDVPPHLFQPLYIDTDITYDLDMSKFPGLDDPQQMYQPALLIATDWNDYVYDNAEECLVDSVEFPEIDQELEDDLFSLIESCQTMFPDIVLSSSVDTELLNTLLDDIARECYTDEFEVSDFQFSELTITPDFNVTDLDDINDVTVDFNANDVKDYYVDISKDTLKQGQKRRRSSDSEYSVKSKKSKMAEMSHLPMLVSVCPTSRNCAVYRES